MDRETLWSLSSQVNIRRPAVSHIKLEVSRIAENSHFHTYRCSFSQNEGLPAVLLQTPIQVKVLRGVTNDSTRNRTLALAEAVERWSSLSSAAPNGIHIAHLIAEPILPEGSISMPYYMHGNLLRYHLEHPQISLLPILSECALTVAYIHEKGIVHGNIRANNFLMDSNGQAQLSDIGIHKALRVDNFNSAWRYRRHSSAYADDVWLEITPEDDVYAFAMMIYELYTGEQPFPHLKDVLQTIVIIADHGLPVLMQPPSMSNALWTLVQDCVGTRKPQPTMLELVQRLSEIHS